MIAIYFEFLGDHKNAHHYKQQVNSLKEEKIVKDEKIEILLKGIID